MNLHDLICKFYCNAAVTGRGQGSGLMIARFCAIILYQFIIINNRFFLKIYDFFTGKGPRDRIQTCVTQSITVPHVRGLEHQLGPWQNFG